ncbi:amino acid ABC transporter permease [Paraburkholderia sp. RL18-103-BIB-C]|jgi:polar amino acid transport system permease protein|uniref:amino acid ABC transporter permease n=1 Tax=unclassified Paraburkholderia TaxID=2615204 RepID=UPI0038B7F261
MNFNFAFLLGYVQPLLEGLALTAKLTLASAAAGIALGFVASLLRTYGPAYARAITTGYVELFRGTPLLVQLFWFFFCLPLLLHINISVTVASFTALSLYMGAITCETFRASLGSIKKEELDACVALGLNRMARVTYIILPLTFVRSMPTLLSNIVSLFKESALVSALGMADLMFVGQNIANTSARPVEVLTTTAIIYFVVAYPLTRCVGSIERRVLQRF